MDVRLHQVPERLEYHSLPLQGPDMPEPVRNDSHLEVTPAIGGAGVATVPVALVNQFQLLGFKSGFQPSTYQAKPCLAHGRTCLKGCTSTDS